VNAAKRFFLYVLSNQQDSSLDQVAHSGDEVT
jgi:hypothetical protein